ncbi:MAG: hypothetical protein HOD92_07830 [Deltaproteobacteria bacterium]|jgi:hypothetical protein|nr:hypothetical protein [Deltaproteobacteria bacterium]MBT4526968.1 hypothetical protein [Deltaproteobacteria bacterium]
MNTVLTQLPTRIQDHIKNIASTSGLEDTEASYEKIAKGWLDKEKSFLETITQKGLREEVQLPLDDSRGGIALTYSGSLILVGPLKDGYRKAAYYSIGLRKDVPDSLKNDSSQLEQDILIDQSIVFLKGPIKKTSPIYKFAVCEELIAIAEQEEIISEATIIITNDFIDINKAIIPV